MDLDPDQPPSSLDDCRLSEEELDRTVPLDARWPEPRLLHQTEVWFSRDGMRWRVPSLAPYRVRELLDGLLAMADDLHGRAVVDEIDQTSPLLEWAYGELGVDMIVCLDPLVWVESTELVRWLRARA